MLDAIKTWVDAVQSLVPKAPSVQVPLGAKVPKPDLRPYGPHAPTPYTASNS